MDSNKFKSYPALTEIEYANMFSTFVAKSTEWNAMLHMMKPVVDRFNGKSVKLMSIGAGTGSFEQDLINKLGLQLTHFHAIEPNPFSLVQLKKTVSNWDSHCKVDSNYFTPEMEVNNTFDIILMSHCLYSIDQPLRAILKGKSLLKPDGTLIIFHHSDKGGYELHTHLIQNATFDRRPLSNESISSKELSNMLDSSGVNYYLTESHSTVEVDDFVQKRNSPTANDVINFILQTRFENLSDKLKTEIFNMVQDRCLQDSEGKYVLYHPVAMIQIGNITQVITLDVLKEETK